MSPAFPTRRRADEFDRLVDSAGGDARPEGELGTLVALAATLRERPPVQPRAAFSADLRERLMAAAATELVSARDGAASEMTVAEKLTVRRLGDPTRSTSRPRRLTAGVVVAVILGGTAGTAYASEGSLPGDTLYPVKRVVESVRSGLSVGDNSKGSTILGEADTRLSEVRKLTRSGQTSSAGQVSKTLETFSKQATQASDLLLSDYRQHQDRSAITKLHSFAASGIDKLATLDATLPSSAKGALTDATQTLLLIDQAAAALCPDCGTGITQLPSTLVSGLSATLGDLDPGLLPGGTTAPEASGSQSRPQGQQATGTKSPAISLPSVDPDSLLPGSLTGVLGGSGSQGSSTSTGSDKSDTANGSANGSASSGSGGGSANSGTGTGSSPAPPKPTSLGDALNGTVDGVVGGVGGLVGGLTGGLTSGLTGSGS